MKNILLGGLIALWALAGSAGAIQHYGLFVGLNQYSTSYIASDNWLNYCVPDAVSLQTNLISHGGGWATTNTTLLSNSAGNKIAIRFAISNMAAKAVSGDVAVYYHSSHGGNNDITQANVFLCSYNADYTEDELAADLSSFKTGVKVIVIVDACHSGGLFVETPLSLKAKAARQAAARNWNLAARVTGRMTDLRMSRLASGAKDAAKLISPNEIGWMTACAYYEYSYEDESIGHGWFTYRILQGFDHGDANSNGQATFQELFDYAYLRIPYADQVPQDFNSPILAANAGAAGATPPGDIWDFADNVIEGATAISPAYAVQTHGVHALRKDLDESDFFAIPVVKNRCYTFRSTNLTGNVDAYLYTYSEAEGARMIRYAYDINYPSDLNFQMVFKPVASGTVYLKVQPYFSSGTNASYVLRYSNTGTADSMATLSNGVTKSIASIASNSYEDFRIAVPAGQTNLAIRLSGGTGDSDLYVARGYIPLSDQDYLSAIAGNTEAITVTNPVAGDWFIEVYGYQASANMNLVATYTPGGATIGAVSSTATHATFSLDLTNNARVSIYAATNLLPTGHWNWTLRSNAATVASGQVTLNVDSNLTGQIFSVGKPLDY